VKILRVKKGLFTGIVLFLVLASVLVWSAILPVAGAFSPGNHDDATQPALDCRVSPDAMEAIKQANKAVDDDPNYDPTEHFDRDPTKTSDQCFRESVKHVQAKKAEAIAAINGCHTEAAIKAIGEALHKIQDFYAHSNYVDLSVADQKTLRDAFENPDIMDAVKVPLPNNLRLAAYINWGKDSPDSYNPSLGWNPSLIPGFIPEVDPRDGKPYDHGLYWGKHKDKAPVIGPFGVDLTPGDGGREITRDGVTGEIVPKNTPGGVTKTAYEWAMEAAKKHSQELIDQIIKNTGDLWDQKLGKPDNYTFPKPPDPKPSVPLPDPKWDPYPYVPGYPYHPFEFQIGVFGNVSYEGGILDDGEGTAVFVPSGAVPTPEWFYAFYVSPDLFPIDYLPEGVRLIKVREFWPDGMQFQEPVTISMVYSLSEIVGVSESSLRAYEFDLYNDCTWRLIPDSTLDTANRTVTFQTSYFSIYGIGGSPPPVGGIVELPGIEEPGAVTPDSSGHNYGALAGIIVGATVGVIMLISAAWYIRRRRTKAI